MSGTRMGEISDPYPHLPRRALYADVKPRNREPRAKKADDLETARAALTKRKPAKRGDK
ncbi:hypothetical protein LG047_15440 [Methylocystis sp. WRRC1]|uniref:hypothetical protein n=1 Tax=Methylocystis sp. WRRC1 TaxID=1732014 RepID=UPI001D13910F|nr:hypothetical protein [Methylocystis sp. WRRC1]MCC3246694.1 hypothetical protein [Methylocystis sp. WRRC1]